MPEVTLLVLTFLFIFALAQKAGTGIWEETRDVEILDINDITKDWQYDYTSMSSEDTPGKRKLKSKPKPGPPKQKPPPKGKPEPYPPSWTSSGSDSSSSSVEYPGKPKPPPKRKPKPHPPSWSSSGSDCTSCEEEEPPCDPTAVPTPVPMWHSDDQTAPPVEDTPRNPKTHAPTVLPTVQRTPAPTDMSITPPPTEEQPRNPRSRRPTAIPTPFPTGFLFLPPSASPTKRRRTKRPSAQPTVIEGRSARPNRRSFNPTWFQ